MLVLSRKVGQRVVINDNITLVINRVVGNRVSIGIEAPDQVKIMRGELQEIRDQFIQLAPEEREGTEDDPVLPRPSATAIA